MPPGVKRAWVMSDGTVKKQLTDEEMKAFKQKIVDFLVPIVCEQIMEEHAREISAQEKAG